MQKKEVILIDRKTEKICGRIPDRPERQTGGDSGWIFRKKCGQNRFRTTRKTRVQQAVSEAIAERSRRTGVNQDRVVRELARIAFSNFSDIVDPDTARIREDATEDDLACIQSIKIKPNEFGTEREVRLFDKRAALVDLGKHLGMWNKDAGGEPGEDGVTIVNDAPDG